MTTSETDGVAGGYCATPGCGKEATMRCPTCIKLGLPLGISRFCSQECFKASWPTHKRYHKRAADPDPQWWTSYKFSGALRPARVVMPMRTVPPGTELPDYAITTMPESEIALRGDRRIDVKTPEEIEIMREVCLLGRQALDLAGSMIKPGVTGEDIDAAVHQFIASKGAYPSPLNYYGFPKACCVSVNEVICHGIPDMRPLEEGDICNVDISVFYKGHHSDLNETFPVGAIDADSERLVRTAYECLDAAIQMCKPGVMYRELGPVITRHAQQNDCSVVTTYCGHGIGKLFHCPPNVPHHRKNKAVGVMRPGHTFTIEPMINLGTHTDNTWPDGWTAVTTDGKRSAQFEQTLLITDDGCEVLTARLDGKSFLEAYLPSTNKSS